MITQSLIALVTDNRAFLSSFRYLSRQYPDFQRPCFPTRRSETPLFMAADAPPDLSECVARNSQNRRFRRKGRLVGGIARLSWSTRLGGILWRYDPFLFLRGDI